jgi:2-keto-4-pentenoate hydratase
LEQAAISRAAQLFVDARRSGQPIRELPDECKPANTADVNAIVDAVTEQLTQHGGETIGGWKIGFVYRPRHRPMICPLFNSRLFASPARVPLSLTPSLRIEPEISFRLKRDLPPRAAPFRAAEVADAIVACPSLEIIDTRFDTSHRSIRQMIDDPKSRLDAMADHNTTGAYVTGVGREDWQGFDFAAMRMVMRTRKRVIVESIGGHAFVDPFLPCVVLANEMRHRGGMRAGELMVTGSFSGFFEVEPDDPVTVEFVGFGSAEATFTKGQRSPS